MNIRGLLITAFVLIFCAPKLSAQTQIKTNALYWLGLLPNVQIETALGEHLTLQGEANASLWKSLGKDGYPMLVGQFLVGMRYYPKAKFDGFYCGADFGYDVYEMTKWNYWDALPNGIFVQNGVGYYLGVTLGYQIDISKRWKLDFYGGGGWHLGKYSVVKKMNDGTIEPWNGWNGSGEWIPFKLGVAFGLRLGK